MSARARPEPAGRAASRRPPEPCPLVALGLTKRYRSVAALADVDLCVAPGTVVGLVGPNGSGKTTLLHIAAGLTRPDAGEALVAGAVAGTRAARERVALIPDEPSGFDELTVAEFIQLVQALWSANRAAAARADVLIEAFGLGNRCEDALGALSRGLRRQAAAIAALSLGRPLLLVDEATATLDPEAVIVLSEAVRALARRGAGVLLATQDLHFAARVCDEVVLLARGRVLDRGAPDELRSRHRAASIEDVFLAAVGQERLRERIRDGLDAL